MGGIDHIEGRKIFAKGELRTVADDRLSAEAEALFISMEPESFQRVVNNRVEPQPA